MPKTNSSTTDSHKTCAIEETSLDLPTPGHTTSPAQELSDEEADEFFETIERSLSSGVAGL